MLTTCDELHNFYLFYIYHTHSIASPGWYIVRGKHAMDVKSVVAKVLTAWLSCSDKNRRFLGFLRLHVSYT